MPRGPVRIKVRDKSAESIRSQVFASSGEVDVLLGCSGSTGDRIRSTDRTFPKPIRVPGRSRPVWRVADVLRWSERLK